MIAGQMLLQVPHEVEVARTEGFRAVEHVTRLCVHLLRTLLSMRHTGSCGLFLAPRVQTRADDLENYLLKTLSVLKITSFRRGN